MIQRSIAVLLCSFLSSTFAAEPQSSPVQQPPKIQLAAGFVYWGHCDKKCDEMKCPNTKACYKACVDNKGTLSFCPK